MSANDRNWWRGSVIYQIYPRSFLDANGDGIGDLEGIRRKLDYVADLGVDAIWISPFFRSPMKDFGYDVSDYCAVDPMFGSLSDFDRVVAEAHDRNLKVMIDQVLSHTSDQHPWFAESRADRSNAKADWYVWSDGNPDGTPPNNWLSVFGGSAWQWDTRRCQFYLHNFLPSQPDLNWHNPEVVEAMLENLRFWLERGVDGFRLDAINYAFHDPALRSNEPLDDSFRPGLANPENPYSFQQHVYDKSRPEMIGLLQRLRALADEYGATALMGEIGDDNGRERMAEYTGGGDKLHMAYSFDLLTEASSAAFIRETVEGVEGMLGDGYACWSVGNHDTERVATRWGRGADPDAVGPLYMALVLSLRGAACVYQGDELGLTEAELAFEDLQDPYGINMWPRYKGRDGCRTPMPWEAGAPQAGFTDGTPWLPIPSEHREQAVDVQRSRSDSALERCRAFLAFRRAHPALVDGTIRFHDAPGETLLFERESDDERLLVAFNLAGEPAEIRVPDGLAVTALSGHGFAGEVSDGHVCLPGYQALFARF
ncbi:alpha-glucosidase family protein [Arhodomonas sp. AD133]|uniref:alpha-glucosidase family protein n=1 Tax=Arhodomonas sp. AD133 TaxID=3415009 RepID=UPI003EBB9FCB